MTCISMPSIHSAGSACWLLFFLLPFMLPWHTHGARNLQQGSVSASTRSSCQKTKITHFVKPLCLQQYMRVDPDDPRSASVVMPANSAQYLQAADSACAMLGHGPSDLDGWKYGPVSRCYNGKLYTIGPSWTELTCCRWVPPELAKESSPGRRAP